MPGTHPLIVIGHKNPDTDSICSALAYARLKNDILGEPAKAFRAGNLNAQTSFVLSRFQTESPPLLTDVYPKIADIMIKGGQLTVLNEKDTLGLAQDIIVRNRFSFLPVVDQSGRCSGKISALRLAGLTQTLSELSQPKRIIFDVGRFTEALSAHTLTRQPLPAHFSGRLFISGISKREVLEGPGPIAYLTTPDEQERLELPAGVRIAVVCGEGELSPKVPARAEEKHLHLIRVSADLLSTAVQILLAMPIRDFVDREHPTFKAYDLIRNVRKQIGKYNEGGFIVLDDDGFIQGVITRLNFLHQSRFRVVMVDHNEISQGVDGLEEAQVVEVVDHHRLGNQGTDAPISFINKVVGSTATIIAELYRACHSDPDPSTAGLLLSAILSDTVILKSPTTTRLDQEMAEGLASRVGVHIKTYGEEMFAAGSALEGLDPRAIVKQDRKSYTEGEWKLGISQIEIVGYTSFFRMKEALTQELETLAEREGCSFSCLLITDITRESSLLLCTGSRRLIDAVTYPQIEKSIFEMKGVLSRKMQVLPYLLDLIRGL